MRNKKLLKHDYKPLHNSYSHLNALQKKRIMPIRFRLFTICVLFLVLGFTLLASYQMLFFPRLKLNGSRVVEVEYKSKFKDPGYRSSYQGKDISSQVKVSGKVDSSRLGSYPITYQVTSHGMSTIKTRIVKVVDSKAPQIEFLTDNKELYICPDTKYLYDDYKAIDNYDGDITDQVKVKEIGNVMKYQVKDSSGNQTVVERKVLYKDIEKPSLTLDTPTIMLMKGEAFTDSTYQVKDNCSSHVKVSVSGNVDTNQVGEYERVFKAKDDYGNVTKKIQKVIVMEPVKKGVIYLTFDDGPRSGTTDIILNILKEKGVKATFFVTSSGPDDLIKREFDEGHSIGLHTASHNYSSIYSSSDAYFDDLKIVSDRVERITGQKPSLLRFPGGSSNTISKHYSVGIMSYLTKEVINRGYRYYDWNIDSRDAEGGRFSASQIASFVTSKLSHDKVNMVLMHDVKVTTKDALASIIDYGLANGYSFEAITPYTDMVVQRVNN